MVLLTVHYLITLKYSITHPTIIINMTLFIFSSNEIILNMMSLTFILSQSYPIPRPASASLLFFWSLIIYFISSSPHSYLSALILFYLSFCHLPVNISHIFGTLALSSLHIDSRHRISYKAALKHSKFS